MRIPCWATLTKEDSMTSQGGRSLAVQARPSQGASTSTGASRGTSLLRTCSTCSSVAGSPPVSKSYCIQSIARTIPCVFTQSHRRTLTHTGQLTHTHALPHTIIDNHTLALAHTIAHNLIPSLNHSNKRAQPFSASHISTQMWHVCLDSIIFSKVNIGNPHSNSFT